MELRHNRIPTEMSEKPEFDFAFRARLKDLFIWRRDVRRFRHTALPGGALERLIEIACLAPSVGLSEPWRFVAVDDADARRAVRSCFETCNGDALNGYSGERAALYARLKLEGLTEAPAQLAVFVERTPAQGHGLGRRTMPETIEYSAVMAIHTMWLAARAEGLGLGWISILDPQRIAAILQAPPDWTLVGYLCIGYPAAEDDAPSLEREGWERREKPLLIRR